MLPHILPVIDGRVREVFVYVCNLGTPMCHGSPSLACPPVGLPLNAIADWVFLRWERTWQLFDHVLNEPVGKFEW